MPEERSEPSSTLRLLRANVVEDQQARRVFTKDEVAGPLAPDQAGEQPPNLGKEPTGVSVLILGNGISRKLFEPAILAYRGEVWGCNRVWKEPWIEGRLDFLHGHVEVLEEARAWLEANGGSFAIKEITCPPLFRADTGTTLVAQALFEGLSVECCGFDLGGPDVGSPLHWTQFKDSWVDNWRRIGRWWSLDRVSFWGFDHKDFLKDTSRGPDAYAERYTRGLPHIAEAEYRRVFADAVRDDILGWG